MHNDHAGLRPLGPLALGLAGCVGSALAPPDRQPTQDSDPGCEAPGLWYSDADGDGWGAEAVEASCVAPSGAVAQSGDCDDAAPDTWPGAPEWCDGLDTDCDGDSADAGRVSWTPEGGVPEDLSARLAGGQAGAPVSVRLDTPGRLAVCSGTFFVRLTLGGAAITVEAPSGPTLTALSGGGVGTPLRVEGATAQVLGLTLTGGLAEYGGGLACEGGSLTLEDGVLSGNHATLAGGGLYLHAGCAATVRDVTVRGNTSDLHAGGGLVDNASLSGGPLTLSDNQAASTAGGLYLLGSTLELDQALLEANTARRGGALALTESSATLRDCAVQHNTANADGGAVYADAATLTLEACTFSQNSAPNAGGGLLLFNSSAATFTGGTVQSNEATLGGGAYVALDSTLSAAGTAWISNTPEDVFHDTAWWFDGAPELRCAAGTCTLSAR